MTTTDHYDVVIIGSGAGGARLNDEASAREER